MADYASESGHWYALDGSPRYTIVGKNGKERPTTLRDAREHGWVPSVTTIMACAHKYQLEAWKQEQAALAALTSTRREGETDSELVKRVLDDAKEQAKAAAARGTLVHAAVECYFGGMPPDRELMPWVESIENLLTQTFGLQEWRPEKSFASPLGYGGKVDLHSDSVLVDFKGKEGDRSKWQTYDDHAMQLAAYARGLHLAADLKGRRFGEHGMVDPFVDEAIWPTCGIVFFDRNEPYAEYHEVKAEALERGWQMFTALLAYWKAANRVA